MHSLTQFVKPYLPESALLVAGSATGAVVDPVVAATVVLEQRAFMKPGHASQAAVGQTERPARLAAGLSPLVRRHLLSAGAELPLSRCDGEVSEASTGMCRRIGIGAPAFAFAPAIARAKTARRRSGAAGPTIALQAAAVELWVTLTPPRQRRATSSITVSVTGPRRAAGRRLIATPANLSTRFRGSLGESVNVSGRREVDDCDVRHGNTSFRIGTRCVAAIRLLPFPI